MIPFSPRDSDWNQPTRSAASLQKRSGSRAAASSIAAYEESCALRMFARDPDRLQPANALSGGPSPRGGAFGSMWPPTSSQMRLRNDSLMKSPPTTTDMSATMIG